VAATTAQHEMIGVFALRTAENALQERYRESLYSIIKKQETI